MLNAFRHQRFNTITDLWEKTKLKRCSTPFGIRDSTQLQSPRSPQYQASAQRLSASEIQHPQNSVSDGIIRSMCSTPFGIRDSTLAINLSARNFSLTCSTPFGIRDSTLTIMLNRVSTNACAQRLSASEIQHCLACHAVRMTAYVLNAFRHQRFNTSVIISVPFFTFCAQRLSASEIQHSWGL